MNLEPEITQKINNKIGDKWESPIVQHPISWTTKILLIFAIGSFVLTARLAYIEIRHRRHFKLSTRSVYAEKDETDQGIDKVDL